MSNFKCFSNVIIPLTGPTILATVKITIQRVTCTLLSDLLGFLLKLVLKFLHFLSQISYLAGISAALLPGLLHGIEGLSRLVFLLAIFIEPVTLNGVVRGEGPTSRLAPFSVLGSARLLGGLSVRTAFIPVLPRHVSTRLGGRTSLGLTGSGFFVVFLSKDLLDVL